MQPCLKVRTVFFTVHQIDLASGALGDHRELRFPFVLKLNVYGNSIYFNSRNNLEDNVKQLYRLEL